MEGAQYFLLARLSFIRNFQINSFKTVHIVNLHNKKIIFTQINNIYRKPETAILIKKIEEPTVSAAGSV